MARPKAIRASPPKEPPSAAPSAAPAAAAADSSCCARLKAAAKALKREVLALYYASLDPSVGCLPKVIVGFAIAYALSPIDLIPDFIPVLGILDDLLLLPGLLWLARRLIPDDAMQRARARADTEPLRLEKHLGAAMVFLLLWLCAFMAVAAVAVERWPLARAHAAPTYAAAFVLFLVVAVAAVLSESDGARAFCCGGCCRQVDRPALAEPLLPV